jgi:hypothetical protein
MAWGCNDLLGEKDNKFFRSSLDQIDLGGIKKKLLNPI